MLVSALKSSYLPVTKANAAMSKRCKGSKYSLIWRGTEYVGVDTTTWEIRIALADCKMPRRIAEGTNQGVLLLADNANSGLGCDFSFIPVQGSKRG